MSVVQQPLPAATPTLPQFVLYTKAAEEMVQDLIRSTQRSRDPRAPEYGLKPTLEWDDNYLPSGAMGFEGSKQHRAAMNLVRTAHNQVLIAPPNMKVDLEVFTYSKEYEHFFYRWVVDLGYTSRYTTRPEPVEYLTTSKDRGLKAAINILNEAVSTGNRLIQSAYMDAGIMLAKTTTNPEILRGLCDHAEEAVRDQAVQNLACPDEGKVIAALRATGPLT